MLPGLAATLFLIYSATAQEPDKNDPAAQLASFKLAPGFEANLFASEKDGVIKPIQMRWDTRGRLWVVQSTTYPQLQPGEKPNDKVLILADSNHDGIADKTTVFADGLLIPTGLELGDGGAYVGEGPRLWHLRDTNGDDIADERRVLLRGFGTGDNHQNINSFRWTPGGELVFSQGLHAHSRVETPHGIIALHQAGFWRLRPREPLGPELVEGLRLDSFFGGGGDPQNPWGFLFTDWGQMLLIAGNNGGIFYTLPELIRGHVGGRRENIWVEARGRKTSGPDLVGTAHFPDDWQGTMLTGGYINNAVWALKVEDDGAGFRITDREPLVTSTHGSFRPVDAKFGPDGALYLCDWYNPIIGHYQASFRHPDRDKAHGRIWRITATGRPLVQPPPIAGAPLEDLLENLRSPERWVREQTRRELADRKTADVVKALRAWWPRLAPDEAATERLLYEAITIFETHESPEPALLKRLLAAKSSDARAYAAMLLARWQDRLGFDPLETLADLAHDAHPRVRLAAIVAAGNIPRVASTIIALTAPNPDGDKFLELAARTAVAVLEPQWKPFVAKGAPDWKPAWRTRLEDLQKPAPPPASARSTTIKLPDGTTRIRATVEFVADLVAEARGADAHNGAKIFQRPELACVTCHSIAGKGGTIGPALDNIGSGQPLDFIIGTVLDPQREVKESYEALQVTAKDGRIVIGYIVMRDEQGTTVKDPATGAETHFPAAEIAATKMIGSLMPAGLVDALPRADLRDLFRYLSELGKAK